MRKRIGVIIGETDTEYSMELISYVFEKAKEYDYDVVAFSNHATYDKNLTLFSDGEKSVINIPDYPSFEGFIVEESGLNIPGMDEELYRRLCGEAGDTPVIYLKAVKERYHSVLAPDKAAIRTVTEHFIRHHGFTRICHMAGRRDLDDAHERLQGYLDAMEAAHLPVEDHMVYWGDYWYGAAAAALDAFLHGGEEYPEAIVCANDYMAIAMIQEIQKRGKRVPEDVCVSGYDNSEAGVLLSPALTTIEVSDRELAHLAVEAIYRLRQGEEVPKLQYPAKELPLILRDSCGCGRYDEQSSLARKLRYMESHTYGLDMCVSVENGYHIAVDLDGIFSNADGYFRYNRAEEGYVCLCDDAISGQRRPIDQADRYTDKVVLHRVFYLDDNKNYDSPETVFDRKELLPPEFFETEEPQTYYVYPVHSMNYVYGYLVLRYEDQRCLNKFTLIYTRALGAAIDNYTIRSGYADMDEIRKLYLMDELTRLNNRRGYEQNLRMCIDRAKRRKLRMTLVSIDMDGLKYINDNFGHSEGDFGIVRVAEAIRACLEEDDIAARNGGDEFAVILLSQDPGRPERFAQSLARELERANAEAKKPYHIHASMGFCPVDDINGKLTQYMDIADDRMYENKKEYKKLHPEYVR